MHQEVDVLIFSIYVQKKAMPEIFFFVFDLLHIETQ